METPTMITNSTCYTVYSLNGGNSKTILHDKAEAIALAKEVQGKAWEYAYDESGKEVETVVYEAAAHMAMVIKNQGRNPLNNQGYLDQLALEASAPSVTDAAPTLRSGNPKPTLRTPAKVVTVSPNKGAGNTHVVMDNLSIVDGNTWHTQKARRHTKLYVGSLHSCKDWKEAYIQDMLA